MCVNYNSPDFEPDEGLKEAAVPFTGYEPVVSVSSSLYASYVKRFLDIFLVLLSAALVVPAVFIFIVLIKRDGGSAFYRQSRVGRDGEIFECLKLRSMVSGADELLEEHLAENPSARAEWDEYQKLKNDPRVTRMGQFLRQSSLDELPQLWCVLKGDMSIVGPRPFLPEQRGMYAGQTYYQVRPGITGLWQVEDHNESCFSARAGFDDTYAKSITFLGDLKIMFRTVWVMLNGRGR